MVVVGWADEGGDVAHEGKSVKYGRVGRKAHCFDWMNGYADHWSTQLKAVILFLRSMSTPMEILHQSS